MPIRMTGMISGLDTESIISELVKAQKTKNKKVTDKQTKLTWTQEKWKELNSKIYKLYTDQVSDMRLQASYKTRKITSTNDSLVTATGTINAPEGSHTISVNQLASSQYVTGDKTTGLTKSSKLSEAGVAVGTQVKVTVGSNTTVLQIKEDTTVGDFVGMCQTAGLNASFDEKQGRFFISSKSSGVNNKFTISTSTLSSEAISKRDEIENFLDYKNLSSANKAIVNQSYNILKNGSTATDKEKETAVNNLIKIASDNAKASTSTSALGYMSAKEEYALRNDSDLMSALRTKHEKNMNEDTTAKEKIKAELTAEVKKQIAKEKEEGTISFTTEEEELAEINRRVEAQYPDKIEEAIQKNIDAEITARVNTNLSEDDKQEELKNLIASGLTADQISSDISSGKISSQMVADKNLTAFVNETEAVEAASGKMGDLIVEYSEINETVGENVGGLSAIGLTDIDGSEKSADSSGNGTVVVAAADSEIVLNGAVLTSDNNSISVNGMNIDIKGITKGETVTLNVTNDTQGTYDMIKNFISSYNEIIKELNTLYDAPSSKGYDPLTDDEKSAMTEKQIEQWEDKIKDSLLRRDTTLGNLLSSMKTSMAQSVEVDGKRYSLSTFGICTSMDWTEKGLLHIYGDKDDSVYKSEDDKLMKALTEDPETVAKALSGIAKNLYDTMADKMKATSLSGALTFYNDIEMKNLQDSYKKQVKTLENKLQDMEERYYKQFAAMESALSKLNSQSSALSGLLGN